MGLDFNHLDWMGLVFHKMSFLTKHWPKMRATNSQKKTWEKKIGEADRQTNKFSINVTDVLIGQDH